MYQMKKVLSRKYVYILYISYINIHTYIYYTYIWRFPKIGVPPSYLELDRFSIETYGFGLITPHIHIYIYSIYILHIIIYNIYITYINSDKHWKAPAIPNSLCLNDLKHHCRSLSTIFIKVWFKTWVLHKSLGHLWSPEVWTILRTSHPQNWICPKHSSALTSTIFPVQVLDVDVHLEGDGILLASSRVGPMVKPKNNPKNGVFSHLYLCIMSVCTISCTIGFTG